MRMAHRIRWPAKEHRLVALSPERPLFAFAGIWTDWTGTHGTKANRIEGQRRLYGFLTTEPNGVVAPVHTKVIPVIMRGDE
jgi:putative SOS response-associated peptidase YedK